MELALMLWTFGDEADPGAFTRIGRAAEEHGFDAVVAGDHVTFPERMPDAYPFGSGTPPMQMGDDCYDVFQVLTHVAAVTDDLRVGTNMVVAPLRHPVTLAKHAFTLEALSAGRLDFGVSTGWLDTEFDVLGVPFEERGARVDEFLDIFTRARAEAEIAHDGDHFSFQTTGFHPVPDDGNRPPVWIGGTSGAAIRRLGQYGTGIVSVWDDPAEITELRDRCANAWSDFDRAGDPRIGTMKPIAVGDGEHVDATRRLQGPVDDVLGDFEAYASAGTDRLVLEVFAEGVDAKLEQIARIGSEILPSLE
jgi:probable F420-dependent oxidoreductase